MRRHFTNTIPVGSRPFDAERRALAIGGLAVAAGLLAYLFALAAIS